MLVTELGVRLMEEQPHIKYAAKGALSLPMAIRLETSGQMHLQHKRKLRPVDLVMISQEG